MAAVTAPPQDAPRTRSRDWSRARAAAVRAFGTLRTAATSTARLSPVLVASSLGCGVISAWETFGRGAAWAAGAVALALFDWHRER
ncbi:MAG TPA: hypothetical protein VFU74_21920 [Actinocrinis sp.]|nr:hypothetical protein [Actinocrinis sp.]